MKRFLRAASVCRVPSALRHAAGRILLAACLAGGPGAALLAHEGHDHGADAGGAVQSALPRFVAASELFELVGVLTGEDLILYLDDAGSNAPVDGATVELAIDGGALPPRVAERVGEGIYRLPAGTLAAPGRHALTLSIAARDEADLLAATLERSAPAAPDAGSGAARGLPPLAWLALPVLLAGGALWRLRGRGVAA